MTGSVAATRTGCVSATRRGVPGRTSNDEPNGMVSGGENSLAGVKLDGKDSAVAKIRLVRSTHTVNQIQNNLRNE